MRIAIAQMPMRPTCAENTEGVLAHLRQAKALDADVAVFPECATTGFHRHVPEQVSRGWIDEALARVRSECAALQVAAVVGTPYYPAADENQIWNAAVVIGRRGEVLAVCPKVGLTKSERRFFTAGVDRPTFALGSFSCSVLLCREVRDAHPRISGAGRITFWPGAIAWDSEGDPDNTVTREIASTCARALDTHLVQCNWAGSVNNPELPGLGGSLVLAPTGDLLYESPRDTAGIFTVTLSPVPAAA